MKKSVEQQLLDYLKGAGRISSATLQRMPWHNRNGSLATPRSIVRRLEENAVEGEQLKVTYENGNAFYEFRKECLPKKQVIEYTPQGTVKVSYV